MDPHLTAASYDSLAQHWASGGVDPRNGIRQHERALQFSRHAGRALDIGCGSSGRIIDLLLSRRFAVEGLDISPQMLALARARHPQVVFHHANICTWEFPQSHDFISAWDSIWHVPLALQQVVLQKLCAGLTPGGVLIFTTGGVDVPGEVTNPCEGTPFYHAALGIPALLRLIDQCGCVCRHLEYDQLPEQHVYFVVQRTGSCR